MNEFVAKKLGEVWAFSRIGLELVERGEEAAVEALGDASTTDTFVDTLQSLAGDVADISNETTSAKADATEEKLRGMMEAYIGDEWDNPVELMEWLSFFLGSAAGHWSLVNGAASSMDDASLQQTAGSAVAFYNQQLTTTQNKLHQHGKAKA